MKNFNVRNLIRPDLLTLPGYVAIEPTDVLARRLGIDPAVVLKLDGNENPYGPSPKALEAIRRESAYHIYPDPDQRAAREAIAGYLNGAWAPSPAMPFLFYSSLHNQDHSYMAEMLLPSHIFLYD